jgi:hypothetical protein
MYEHKFRNTTVYKITHALIYGNELHISYHNGRPAAEHVHVIAGITA